MVSILLEGLIMNKMMQKEGCLFISCIGLLPRKRTWYWLQMKTIADTFIMRIGSRMSWYVDVRIVEIIEQYRMEVYVTVTDGKSAQTREKGIEESSDIIDIMTRF